MQRKTDVYELSRNLPIYKFRNLPRNIHAFWRLLAFHETLLKLVKDYVADRKQKQVASVFAIITHLCNYSRKEKPMNLKERERTILQLARQGLSDYRIARKINTDPPSVTRSRKTLTKNCKKPKQILHGQKELE